MEENEILDGLKETKSTTGSITVHYKIEHKNQESKGGSELQLTSARTVEGDFTISIESAKNLFRAAFDAGEENVRRKIFGEEK